MRVTMNTWWQLYCPISPVFYFASVPTVTEGAGGGAPTSTPSGSEGSGSGGGAGAGTAAASPSIDWKTAPQQFRSEYERLKTEHENLNKQYEPWKGLNLQPGQVTQFQQGYQQVYSEIKGVADSLEIPEQEVAYAIRQFGLPRVLDHLRQEAWEAEQAQNGNQEILHQRELDERINNTVQQALSPYQERENVRLTTAGNTLVETTIGQLATEAFKASGLDFTTAPDPFKMFVLTGVTEALKYDDQGLHDIKFQGKVAPIQRAFQTFMSMFDAAYLARRQMESKLPPVRQQAGPQRDTRTGQFKQPTLEEMADNPDIIRTSAGRPSYTT